MELKVTKLQESLLVLAALKNQLEPALRLVKRHMTDDDTKKSVMSYLMILVVSFLDEWKRFEAMRSDPEVLRTLNAAQPALRRIREWKHLSRLRSRVLAHGFRHKDGSLVMNIAALYKPGHAPPRYAEQLLLAECSVYAIAIALSHHKLAHAAAFARGVEADVEEIEEIGISTMDEFHREMAVIRKEMSEADPSFELCFDHQ